ncbi:MAG: hypothetical protein KAU36_08260 [candidate division Zixibacteria bacterium]|nr:hypothetical protein [candidate division Zixibacteria bacterium]
MIRKFVIFSTLLLAMVAFVAMMASAEEAKHEYVGNKKCKGCHKDQFKAWGETTHATSFDKLSDEEKAKPECAKCHTSGTMADGTLLEGVTCEGCHGPGSDYKSPKIMSKKKYKADKEAQRKLALEAGLILPGEADCVTCHTKEGNTNFKPFEFEKRKGEVHPPAVAEAEK